MIRAAFVLFFGLAPLLPAQSTNQPPAQISNRNWTQAASQLAARISSLLPRRALVSLELQNLTPFPAAEWLSFPKLLQDALRQANVETAGAETTAAPPESRVRITLSQNPQGLLFIAEVFTGDIRQVAILPWPLPSWGAKPRVRLSKKALWTQTEPILDILVVDSGSEMLVLSVDKIASYRSTGDRWTPSATASLLLPRPMPRDPRGRLETTAGGFQVFLPVATCTGAWNPELRLTCSSGTANWSGTIRTHWVADRNVLEGDAPAPSFEGWGSDWASIADTCGAGTVVLASSADNEHDSVRAYQVVDRQATPMSDAVPLPGPVTALWPAESDKAATLVVHNLQTGEYEASRLGVACSQ